MPVLGAGADRLEGPHSPYLTHSQVVRTINIHLTWSKESRQELYCFTSSQELTVSLYVKQSFHMASSCLNPVFVIHEIVTLKLSKHMLELQGLKSGFAFEYQCDIREVC